MPNKEFQVGDTTYEFPDSYSDEQVQGILTKQGIIKAGGAQPSEPSFIGIGKSFLKQGLGMVKELGSQGENIADIATLGLKPLAEKQIPMLGKARKERTEATKLKSEEEKTGSRLLQTAEMFAPIPGLQGIKAAEGAGLLARAGASAARGALDVGLKAAVQAGSVSEAGKAALIGGLTSGVLDPAISAMGRKIQAATIRPRLSDVRDGFKWETLDKFKLKGNLEQSMKQVDSRLTELRNARNSELIGKPITVDLKKPFHDASNELLQDVQDLKHGGEASKTLQAMGDLQRDVLDVLNGNTNVDLQKAENLKEHLGTMGAWAYGRPDRESQTVEKVANNLYLKMKDAIEHAIGPAGPKVKALNKQMQELIPVKNAMLARLPVEERNNLFSLQDMITMLPAFAGEPTSLALTGLSRAQKSLRFGNWLSRSHVPISTVAGEALGSTPRAVESVSQ